MSDAIYRETWAEIDLDAIEHNVQAMREKLPKTTEIIAVVKADGYGHGAVQVAKRALKSGATQLAVALLEEAVTLRKAGFDVPILVMGYVGPEHAEVAVKYDITLTMYQIDWLKNLPQHLEKPINVHMKWDTGMGRIGIRSIGKLEKMIEQIKRQDNVKLTGIFTHFATADSSDLTYFHKQRKRFQVLLDAFNELWETEVEIHMGNSAASIRFPDKMHQFIRFGIAMYGLYPSDAVAEEQLINLKPAFTMHSRLSHVKKVTKGDTISYGQTYQSAADEWIGTIPIGYADGWSRQLQGIEVLVDGKRMPIVGRICMDQTMIKLDQPYDIGTKVTLIGHQGDAMISADEVAQYIDTINYEIPCMITSRVPRVYQSKDS